MASPQQTSQIPPSLTWGEALAGRIYNNAPGRVNGLRQLILDAVEGASDPYTRQRLIPSSNNTWMKLVAYIDTPVDQPHRFWAWLALTALGEPDLAAWGITDDDVLDPFEADDLRERLDYVGKRDSRMIDRECYLPNLAA